MQPDIPVVELLRVSSADQAEDDRAGLARQEEANRRTIQRHGLRVVRQFRLVDVSGTATLLAPEIQEMIGLIRNGQIRGIVLADLDRLLRPDDWTSFGIFQPIKEAHALLYLPDTVLDLNTQAGFLMSGLQSVIAGNELAQIKKRMLGAKEEKRRQGKHPNNELSLPLGVGYDKKTERYYYNDESTRVSKLFRLVYADNIHNKAELERLTGLGQRTIANLLRNELYIGYRTYTQKRSLEKRVKADGRQADRRKVARIDSEIIRVKVIDQPLIPEPAFWAVQDILSKINQSFTERRKGASSLFLYKGLLYCSKCGSPMYTVPGGKAGPTKDYYFCRSLKYIQRNGGRTCDAHYLKREVVEEFVTDFVMKHLANKDYILDSLKKRFENGASAQHERDRQDIETRITAQDKKRKRTVDLYTEDVIRRDEFDSRLAKIDSETQRLRHRLDGLAAPRDTLEVAELARIAEDVAGALALFPFWDHEERKAFLQTQAPKIWVTDRNVVKFELPISCHQTGSQLDRGSSPQPA